MDQPRRVGAVDVLGGDPQCSIGVSAVIDRDDVGMIQRGDAECIFPVTALLASRAAALFPAATSALLATVDVLLPSARVAPGQAHFVKGAQVRRAAPNPVRDAATVLGQRAANELNQGV